MREGDEPGQGLVRAQARSPRVLALSDGVFAIIIALLVLDAHIPESRRYLASSSSTVTEVHDDALIATTPRDAAKEDPTRWVLLAEMGIYSLVTNHHLPWTTVSSEWSPRLTPDPTEAVAYPFLKI